MPRHDVAQILACALDPAQVFTLTNTGNVPLTGIGNGVLGGTNATEFTLSGLCCPLAVRLLAGNSWQIQPWLRVQPAWSRCSSSPKTAQTTGVKNATISVTDAAGTQTSTLTGTAN